MNKIYKVALSFSFAALMGGCGSEIDMVKNGTLQGQEQTTVGKAIESALGEVQWNSFESNKGVKIVEASGLPGKLFFDLRQFPSFPISYESVCNNLLLYGNPSGAHFSCFKDNSFSKKITIQFYISANGDSFNVGYCGFGDAPINCDMLFAYLYDNRATYAPIKINNDSDANAQANCDKDDACFNDKCEWICE